MLFRGLLVKTTLEHKTVVIGHNSMYLARITRLFPESVVPIGGFWKRSEKFSVFDTSG